MYSNILVFLPDFVCVINLLKLQAIQDESTLKCNGHHLETVKKMLHINKLDRVFGPKDVCAKCR